MMSIDKQEKKAAYMRQYRAEHPDYRAEDRRRGQARIRALRRLGRHYPEELGELFEEELGR